MDVSVSPLRGIFFCLLIFAIAMIAAMILLAVTPLKTYLPGYLKESERAATEVQHQRLDSLLKIYEVNEAYLSALLYALDPSPVDTVIKTESKVYSERAVDSLLSPSLEEKRFVEDIRERDKFNIAVASTADAEALMFGNLNKAAVISEDSKEAFKAELVLPLDASVAAVAEGKVISIASSPKSSGSYEIIIQHPKGFLSKTSRLASIMVSAGQRVAAGQIIGGISPGNGRKSNIVAFELWHDGNPLIPSRYLN